MSKYIFAILALITNFSFAQNINPDRFAYIINSGSNSYTQCIVESDGKVNATSCKNIKPTGLGILDFPNSIAKNNNYAYITNGGNNSYTQCNIESNGIDSHSCNSINPQGTGALYDPYGITFYKNFAFIVNAISKNSLFGSYTQCLVRDNGIVPATCVTRSLGNILALTTDVEVSYNHIYFVNSGDPLAGLTPNVTTCTLNDQGIESGSCQQSIGKILLYGPVKIGFSLDNKYVFISDAGSAKYLQCPNSESGIDYTSCFTGLSGFGFDPSKIGFSGHYAYVLFYSENGYYQCQVDDSGIIIRTCNLITPTRDGELNGPSGIIFTN